MSGETPFAGPTPATARLDILDVLRGFALSGVLLVNFAESLPEATGDLDRATHWLIELGVTGSFYPLFAMLFGMGFALQVARWEARHAPALRRYLRRVAGLFLFGLAIWCLLHTWWTLLQYAVAGLALLPFRHASPRTLLFSAAAIYALTTVAIPEIRPIVPGPDPARQRTNQQQVDDLKREGSYPALVAARAQTIMPFLSTPRWYLGPGLTPLWLFLLGAAIERSGILRNPTPHRSRLRRLIVWGGLMGITTNLIVWWRSEAGVEGSGILGSAVDAGLDLGDPALALAYGAAIVLLYTAAAAWRRRLAPLASAGRTALSNVVLQWMVISTLLFGYGFGLLDRIGTLTCLLLSVPIFALELWLSHRWLARHRFGPLEWLWRTMTYGRPPRSSITDLAT